MRSVHRCSQVIARIASVTSELHRRINSTFREAVLDQGTYYHEARARTFEIASRK